MQIHPKFQLNGSSLNSDDLIEVGYSLIKEGHAFEIPIGNFLLDWLGPSKTIEVHTSGSTGTPKKIMLEKQHMVNSAHATANFLNLEQGDSALLCLPVEYIAGKMMLVRAIVLGLSLDFVEPSSEPLNNIEKYYDFAAMVPLQVENSLTDLHRIKKLIVGGAKLSSHLEEKLIATKTQVYETYGMTETITHVAMRLIGEPYFKTLEGITISQDKRACLVIEAPHISAKKVITNDLVEIHSNDEFKWLGRFDTIINSGGVKLIPELIENKLGNSMEGRFFVASIPDSTLGEKLVLIIEGNEKDLDLQDLASKSKLNKYEVPKAVFFVPSFIETSTRKINRKATLKQVSHA